VSKAPPKLIRAGGAVVTRAHPKRGTEVVIIHRKRYDDWTLPKGKVQNGELVPATAVREVAEETGVTIRLNSPLDSVRYLTTAGLKAVDWWIGSAVSIVRRAPDAEVDAVAWLPLRSAMSRLTFPHDHRLVEQCIAQPVTTPLILVRHGKAMDRKDWSKSKKDSSRPLAARGRRQAQQLTPLLAAYGVQRLVSSGSTRCVSTLTPYADKAGVKIDKHDELSEEQGVAKPRAVADLVRRVRDEGLATQVPTAICVHRPVFATVLDALDLAPTSLATGELLVAHLTADGEAHAIERHRTPG
jgi:8-oxo-(d)GTP phosphatase